MEKKYFLTQKAVFLGNMVWGVYGPDPRVQDKQHVTKHVEENINYWQIWGETKLFPLVWELYNWKLHKKKKTLKMTISGPG